MGKVDVIICDKCKKREEVPEGANSTEVFNESSPKVLCSGCFNDYAQCVQRIILLNQEIKDRFWSDQYPYFPEVKWKP